MQLKSGKILNPETGRYVNIDGRIGKYIGTNVNIVFTPELQELWSSSLENIEIPHLWKLMDISKFLRWYNYFKKDIMLICKHKGIYFLGFEICDNERLVLRLKKTECTNSDLQEIIRFALNPDVGEKHLIKYNDLIYTVNGKKHN